MKKIIIYLTTILIFPLIVHAETITYNVCKSGCEYEELWRVQSNINALGNLSDKEIIINIDSDYSHSFYLGEDDNKIKSVIINGNNHSIGNSDIYANYIEINELNIKETELINCKKVILNNSNINQLAIGFISNNQLSKEKININDVLEIDEMSLKNVDFFVFGGNLEIKNMNFKNKTFALVGGTVNVYNSQFSKIIQMPDLENIDLNIYNSTFDSLKYKNITSSLDQEFIDEMRNYFNSYNFSLFSYDIYDVNIEEISTHSNTTVYFDKELEIKPNNKINLTEYLDYYTDDKEIDYVIEDESVARIENKVLVGLKAGQTNITVTTDDGHVVYRIKLNVIKEIEIPLSGINVKPWVLIVGIILFGAVGVCIYLLFRSEKVYK